MNELFCLRCERGDVEFVKSIINLDVLKYYEPGSGFMKDIEGKFEK
jgi:hypothetical protein